MKTNNLPRTYSVPIVLPTVLISDTVLPCMHSAPLWHSVAKLLGDRIALTIDFIFFVNMELLITNGLLGFSLFCTKLWF